MIEVIDARSPKWADAAHTLIDLLVTFKHCGEVPFTASLGDTSYATTLYHAAMAGKYGEIAPYAE